MSILESASISKRKRVIEELVQGQEYATQLKFLLQNPSSPSNASVSAKELVVNVLRSFVLTLSVLTSDSDQNLVQDGFHIAASSIDPKSEDSSESKIKRSSPSTKDRRGSYKRRKNEQTWTKVSETTDDGHAWRKYGQKEILNSQFPRSYYRCTRKYDEGCRATKQVQRTQENPKMFQITYIGFHTCKDTINKAPQMVTYSETCDSFPPTIKEEYPNHGTPSDLTANLWSDLKDFELPNTKPALKVASDNADTVYSCTASQTLDMDFGGFYSHFTTDFHFDESHLL